MTRAELDALAWQIIHNQPRSRNPPFGLAACERPCNFRELYDLMERRDDFEHAWSEFCHEFYRHKEASFLEVPPPEEFSIEYQALLAGAAEFWCREFDLQVPAWTEDPQYFLSEPWMPWSEFLADDPEVVARLRAAADPAFLRRNILFAARNLISI
jgi:hypothetical protein